MPPRKKPKADGGRVPREAAAPSGLARDAADPARRLYIFDLDDTVVHTSSKVHTDEGALSTWEYARRRGRVSLRADAFREMAGVPTTVRPGPYFQTFLEALDQRSPVAVVTARAAAKEDAAEIMRRVVVAGGRAPEAADAVTTYCCNAPDFPAGGTQEERKAWAVGAFVERHPDAVSVGFSDDDHGNLRAVRELFGRMAQERPGVRFRIYPVEPSRPA